MVPGSLCGKEVKGRRQTRADDACSALGPLGAGYIVTEDQDIKDISRVCPQTLLDEAGSWEHGGSMPTVRPLFETLWSGNCLTADAQVLS